MILNVYCVFDKVSRKYGPLITFDNDEVAKRSLKEMFSLELSKPNSNNEVVLHSDDMTLYRIGYYDTDAGTLTGQNEPFVIARCGDVRVEVLTRLKGDGNDKK